ncbi:Uncharacterised protein [Vibrio cholerae]|nr:Uncharacterised protein [Vibrio cholerae]
MYMRHKVVQSQYSFLIEEYFAHYYTNLFPFH